MLAELLAGLVPPEQVLPLLETAVLRRDQAMLAYDQREKALSQVAAEAQAGVWRSPELLATITRATTDRLLLSMSRDRFIEAHRGACDLDIEYHPLFPPGHSLRHEDIAAALAFIDKARAKDAAELWFAALQAEGRSHLHQARGDVDLAESMAAAEAVEARLLALLDSQDPYAGVNIQVHAAVVALYFERQLPWRVEQAYRRFLAAFPDDVFAGWRQRCADSPEYEAATSDALVAIVVDAHEVLLLRNPADRSEIERLERLLPPEAFVPMLVPFEPDVLALPDLPSAVFASAAEAFERVISALAAAGGSGRSRPIAVLRAWAAFARRGLFEFRRISNGLLEFAVDDEALGIVVQALRGEARYRMGRYEEAHLDLQRAEKVARAVLARPAPGADTDTGTWNGAERDAVARFAQKAGNALAAIGDEEGARKAYDRARALAVDPLSRAGDLINQGNLHFLHNSVVGGQGYIALDAAARQEFVLRGPHRLMAAVVGRHVTSLVEAERCYRAALDALAELSQDARGHETLLATCHINLGNVAWAWGCTLAVQQSRRVQDLAPGNGFASRLVSLDSEPGDCYEAAIGRYLAGLEALGVGDMGAAQLDGPAAQLRPDALPLVAAALSSLSEMRYLLARELLQAAQEMPRPGVTAPAGPAKPGSPSYRSLKQGLAEAKQCLALLGKDAAVLYPDLAWRTYYNLARAHRLLGRAKQARVGYRRAIRLVEKMRGQLRLDAFQVAFLHDKHDVYEGCIDFLLSEGEAAGDPARHVDEIFGIFERSRARAFLTLLQAANVKADMPADLWGRAEDLLAKISACNEEIQAAVAADDRPEAERLLAEQTGLADDWATVQAEIAQAQRRSQRIQPPIAALAQFQAALAPDQAYLAILLGDETSFALLIDRGAARPFRLPPRRVIELLTLPVLAYATWSNAETASEFVQANVKLTETLLGAADEAVDLRSYLAAADGSPLKHLLVSPDGMLCYLPFDALLADRAGVAALPQPIDYPDLRPFYLLSLADLSYVPSASAWLELGRRKRTGQRRPPRAGLMAVYNVHYDTPEPPLWAVTENILLKLGAVTSSPDMARITQALKSAWPDLENVYLRSRRDDGAPEEAGRQSTEANFLKVAPEARARFLMFYGHGVYNDRYPSLSGLIFNLATPNEKADRAPIPTREDGFLRVEELFQLDLPGVELTLLAACQTALGAYRRGEGLNAVVRGFLHRGSPAVMATLWEVRADMTAFLLRVFFRMLGEQPTADRARLFCQAKRKAIPYVANLCLPYFWAPYVLWGHSAEAQRRGDTRALA